MAHPARGCWTAGRPPHRVRIAQQRQDRVERVPLVLGDGRRLLHERRRQRRVVGIGLGRPLGLDGGRHLLLQRHDPPILPQAQVNRPRRRRRTGPAPAPPPPPAPRRPPGRRTPSGSPTPSSAHRRVLQVDVQVRLRRVPRAADQPEQLPRLHPIADLDGHAALLEVSQEEVLAVADVDEHVVAGRVGGVAPSGEGLAVGDAVDRGHHLARRGRRDPLAPCPVVVVGRARPPVGAAVTPHDEVVGVALGRGHHVVVGAFGVAAPEDEPLAGEREAQRGLGAVASLGIGRQRIAERARMLPPTIVPWASNAISNDHRPSPTSCSAV